MLNGATRRLLAGSLHKCIRLAMSNQSRNCSQATWEVHSQPQPMLKASMLAAGQPPSTASYIPDNAHCQGQLLLLGDPLRRALLFIYFVWEGKSQHAAHHSMSYRKCGMHSSTKHPRLGAVTPDQAYYAGDASRIFNGCTSRSSSAAQ